MSSRDFCAAAIELAVRSRTPMRAHHLSVPREGFSRFLTRISLRERTLDSNGRSRAVRTASNPKYIKGLRKAEARLCEVNRVNTVPNKSSPHTPGNARSNL